MADLPESVFEMTRGDAKSYRITVRDAANAVVDLTAVQAIKAQFRKHPHSAAVITKTLGAGITVENAVNGVFRIDIDPADTSSLGNWKQTYGFDVQVTMGDDPVTVARGRLTIEPDFAQ